MRSWKLSWSNSKSVKFSFLSLNKLLNGVFFLSCGLILVCKVDLLILIKFGKIFNFLF